MICVETTESPTSLFFSEPQRFIRERTSRTHGCLYASSSKQITVNSGTNYGWDISIENSSSPIPYVELISPIIAQCKMITETSIFEMLVSKWKKERGITSSITHMVICPSYQRIIGLGEKAVPLLLQQLESELKFNNPDHWFWALRVITNENPVEEADQGDMNRMAKAWIEWGRSSGYVW